MVTAGVVWPVFGRRLLSYFYLSADFHLLLFVLGQLYGEHAVLYAGLDLVLFYVVGQDEGLLVLRV